MGKYSVHDTPSGHPTLIYNDGNVARLHSSYDPVKEANRAIENFSPGRANIVIICGLGLGYHIQALRHKHPSKKIIVIEKDEEVVHHAKKINPKALNETIILTNPKEIPNLLEHINMATFQGAATYRHRPSYVINKEFYDSFEKNIQQYFSSRLSDMLTRFEFVERWAINILHNATHLFDCLPVKDLFGKFYGFAGIIVSAGPSLRKNVMLLKQAYDAALIVCVDTAFKILEKHNIAPHIVMTLDAQQHSIRHFLGVRQTTPVLVADIVSHPAVLRDYCGNRALSTTSKFINSSDGRILRETTPIVNWIEKWVEAFGDIQSGGSVATSAFDLLLNCGCNPIVLIGQDLAYSGREIHCSGSYHNEEWIALINRFRNLDCINQNIIRKRKIKYVEGWMGIGTVVSDFVFDLYRNWFADSAAKVPVKVINATEGGARIPNTIEMTLKDAIAQFPKPPHTTNEILHSILKAKKRTNNPEKLLSALRAASAAFEEIIDISKHNDKEAIIKKGLEGTIAEIIAPLVKKTEVYLARHPDLPSEKITEILSRDIVKACTLLQPHISKAIQKLEKICKQA